MDSSSTAITLDPTLLSDSVQKTLSLYQEELKKLKQQLFIEGEKKKENKDYKSSNKDIDTIKACIASKKSMLERKLNEKRALEADIGRIEDLLLEKEKALIQALDSFEKTKRTSKEIALQKQYDDKYIEYSSFTQTLAKQLGFSKQPSMKEMFDIEEKQARERIANANREEQQRKREQEEQKQKDKEEAETKRKAEEEIHRKKQDEKRKQELQQLPEDEDEEEDYRPKQVFFTLPELPKRKPNQTDEEYLREVEEANTQHMVQQQNHRNAVFQAKQQVIKSQSEDDIQTWNEKGLHTPLTSPKVQVPITPFTQFLYDTNYRSSYKVPDIKQVTENMPPPSVPKPKKAIKRGSNQTGVNIHTYAIPLVS